MKHLGDITSIDGHKIPAVDVITGGSPCQDLSVAGKRAGLAGERSGLFMEQIRVIKEMREQVGADNIRRPRYMVWENVGGALSSNGGEDFRTVLEEVCKIADTNAVISRPQGKWSASGCIVGNTFTVCWRVHDAQYWGVAQRRKRLCVVADFDGHTAGEILFAPELMGEAEYTEAFKAKSDTGTKSEQEVQSISESLSRDIEQSETERKETSGTVRESIEKASGAVIYGVSAYESNSMKSDNPKSGIYEADTSRTLDNNGGNPACNQGGMVVLEGNGSRPSHKGDGYAETDVSYTLNAVEQHGVCIPINTMVATRDTAEMRTTFGVGENNDPQFTLSSAHEHAVFDARGNGDGKVVPTITGDHESRITDYTAVCIGNRQADQTGAHEKAGALNCMHDQQAVITYARQRSDDLRQSEQASTISESDYKSASDLVCCSFYPQMKAESQCFRNDDVSNTLVNGTNPGFQNGIVTAVDVRNGNESNDINGTLQSKKQGYNVNSNNVCGVNSVVRRLTPVECERLQGFPSSWTDIGDWTDSKGKKHKAADSPRYKALGNSIALPFWNWLMKRIAAYLPDNPTMGSLFDGIGGFPLVSIRAGITPVWASEVEEFCIAVTKKHFGEN